MIGTQSPTRPSGQKSPTFLDYDKTGTGDTHTLTLCAAHNLQRDRKRKFLRTPYLLENHFRYYERLTILDLFRNLGYCWFSGVF